MRLKDILGMFAPATCMGCGAPLVGDEECLCAACEMELERPMVWEPAPGPLWRRVACPHAPIRGFAAWTDYTNEGVAGQLIRKGKYDGMPGIIRALGRIEGRRLTAIGCCAGLDVLLPVPMHRLKRLRRGYNQAEVLAQAIGAELGVPVGDNLVATRGHGPRARQGGEARLDRAASSVLALRHPNELRGLNIGIVDDIITTGTTIADAVTTVNTAHPRSITLITLAATIRE